MFNILKNWLEKNKIYFETVAAVALTFMSILLSYFQYNFSKIHTKMAKIEFQPRLEFNIPEISEKTFYSYGTKKNGKNWVMYNLTIKNSGNSGIRDFTFSYENFLIHGEFGCSKIDFENMRSPSIFPSNINPGEIHSINMSHYSKTEKNDWVDEVVESGRFFGVKFLGKYKVEGFPGKEKNIKIVYLMSYSNPIIICSTND